MTDEPFDTRLDSVFSQYKEKLKPPQLDWARFEKLYSRYAERYQAAVLDAAAIAVALNFNDIREMTDPRVVEAFHLQYPDVDPSELSSYSGEQLQGFANGVKGKLFEVVIRDKLNDGLPVGDLQLSAGEHAVLAESANQPGWDLQILDGRGHVVDHLQAKATDSISYIKDAIDQYPDITVVTDLPGADHLVHGVMDAQVSDAALTSATEHGLAEMSQSFWQDFFHHVNPLIPAIVITTTEGMKVMMGRSTFEKALQRGTNRMGKSVCAMSLAGLLYAANAPGAICVATSVSTRLAIEAYINHRRLPDVIENYEKILERIADNLPY